MMSDNTQTTVFLVVEVMSGVAVDAHCFRKAEEASKFSKIITARRNLDYDDVQVFIRDLPSVESA